MAATPTPDLGFQNFFQATLTGDITASSTDIPMDNIPNSSQGFLVIEPDSATNREVIFYTSKTALKVVCPSAADGRGQDDTSATTHSTGATVIMAPIAAFYEALQNGRSHSLVQYDGNGNEKVEFAATASAVNHPKLSNAATGNPPTLEATGDDTNVALKLKGKGTGTIQHEMRVQTDPSNSIANATIGGLRIQCGYGVINTTAAANNTETVTFPTAFSGVPYCVMANLNGFKGTAPADLSDLPTGITKWECHAEDPDATSFRFRVSTGDGTNLSAGFTGYSWIAIGPA